MGRVMVWIFVPLAMGFLPGMTCVDVVDERPITDDFVPEGVAEFLSDQDISKLQESGLIVYRGSTPPNIEGQYSLNDLVIHYDDLGLDFDIVDYFYSFANQTADGEISVSYSAPDTNDAATGLGAFISGIADCFSVYVHIKGTDDGCNYSQPAIISGCVTSNGIKNWQNGFIWGAKAGTNCGQLVDEGHKRVINENDGLARESADSK